MPQIFRVGPYSIYFWSNENNPFIILGLRDIKKSKPNDSLKILKFPEMSDEWLDFIAQCRSGKTHNYDIVEGPMADDTVWNYVNDFLTGRISRKQFWVLAEFKHPTHQISFHTLSALDCLTYKKSEVVYDRKRKKWLFLCLLIDRIYSTGNQES